jgi:3-hydroxy-5-methyl-1-naphthoate 3-O-methyltransferase
VTTTPQAPITPERIMQFAWGYVPTLVIEAGVKHRVFDTLESGPKTVQQIHEATGASVRGLSAILNALVGIKLLDKTDSHYSLTPESETFLVSTKPGYYGGMISHTSTQLLPSFLQLNEIVATGKPAKSVNQQNGGAEFFEQFVADLFPLGYPAAQTLAQHLNLGSSEQSVKVLDLGAGSGVWSIALAQSAPNVHVTVVDWPGVLNTTKAIVSRFGLSDRYEFVAGDLLEAPFGTGYSAATIEHILHSEGEQRSRQLLARTLEALAPGGTIAIAEFLVDADRSGPPGGLFFAVNMLVNTDMGDTYCFEEISQWLQDAGFVNPRTFNVPGPSPLILATKPLLIEHPTNHGTFDQP